MNASSVQSPLIHQAVLFIERKGSVSSVEGPGNADEAVAYGLDLSGTLPMTELGIPGGKVDWTASLGDSHIEDPITGLERPLSGSRISRLAAHGPGLVSMQ